MEININNKYKMKSIAIIGKGPSIKKCKREWIDKYDKVAICGRPIFKKYEDKLGDRAHYDFCNCGDPRIYGKKEMDRLGIKKVINTNKPILRHKIKKRDCCPTGIDYEPNGRSVVIDFFKNKYNLNPATGTIAIEYLLREKKYNKIGLFGFDLMEQGEDVYYFPKKDVQVSLQVYFNNKTYGKNGKRIEKSGHDLNLTFKYICDVIKNNPQIEFEILSARKFPKLKNVILL